MPQNESICHIGTVAVHVLGNVHEDRLQGLTEVAEKEAWWPTKSLEQWPTATKT